MYIRKTKISTTSIHSELPTAEPCCLLSRRSIKNWISDQDSSALWTKGTRRLTFTPSRSPPAIYKCQIINASKHATQKCVKFIYESLYFEGRIVHVWIWVQETFFSHYFAHKNSTRTMIMVCMVCFESHKNGLWAQELGDVKCSVHNEQQKSKK
jgi:hypothetical protein